MKFKKAAAVVLSSALVLTLGGCTSGTDQVSEGAGSTEQISKAKETSEAGNAGETKNADESKNYFGFSKEVPLKVGLAWGQDFEFKNGDDSSNNAWVDLYRENNIMPEILYEVDSSQGDTKLSTAIMSGDYPDVFAIKSNEYAKYVQSGTIADITDALEEYATPELKEYLNVDDGLSMTALDVDGEIYGLPKMANSYDSMKVMFIRQDWLDTLGLEVPKTMEELKKVAHAFTYNDPDGNGKDDTYGLALDGVEVLTDSVGTATGVFEGFGAYPTNLTFIENDGEVVWGGTLTEQMKAGLTLLQEMYKDGTITKDFITMDSNTIFEEAGGGRCGIFFAPMWGAMTSSYNAAKIDPKAMFTTWPVPDGTGTGESKALFKNSCDEIFVVSSKCENPEVLIKLMNLSVQKLCHPESEEEFIKYYGTSDYALWKAAITQTLEPLKNHDNYLKESKALQSGDTSALNIEQKSDYEYMKAYLDMVEAGNINADDPTFQAGSGLYTVFGNPQGAYAALDTLINGDRFTYAAYNTLPTEKMSEVESTLNKMLVETIVKIIAGDPVDSYDKFLDSWNSLGGEEITKEAQEWAAQVQ